MSAAVRTYTTPLILTIFSIELNLLLFGVAQRHYLPSQVYALITIAYLIGTVQYHSRMRRKPGRRDIQNRRKPTGTSYRSRSNNLTHTLENKALFKCFL